MINKQLISQDDLELLFPNQIQRDIFIKMMNEIINIIAERTVNVPFVSLSCEAIE